MNTRFTNTEKRAGQELDKLGIENSEKEFFKAIVKGEESIVSLFLVAGMSPNAKQGGITALMEASRRGKTHREVAAALITGWGGNRRSRSLWSDSSLIRRHQRLSGDYPNAFEKRSECEGQRCGRTDSAHRDPDYRKRFAPRNDRGTYPSGVRVNIRIYGGLTPLMIAPPGILEFFGL